MLYKISKRTFDIVCAILGIIVALPLWIIVPIGIKLSSKGPIIYTTIRVGLDNRQFSMFKFRSMHLYEPENPNDNRQTEGGFIANSQRMFKFGKFLRKSKIDELPQLINVLMSNMSIVGPRPITKSGVEKNYTGAYSCILSVKPGLTCLDSLYDYAHGELFVASNDDYIRTVLPVRIELAKIYVEEKSLLLDFKIIIRTIGLIVAVAITKKKSFDYTQHEKKAIKSIRI